VKLANKTTQTKITLKSTHQLIGLVQHATIKTKLKANPNALCARENEIHKRSQKKKII
jgi:hypothetical protein